MRFVFVLTDGDIFYHFSGRSLLHVALHVFQEHDLIRTFQLDIVKLMRCISKSASSRSDVLK